LILRQILLTSSIRNEWRTVKRMSIFIPALKGLNVSATNSDWLMSLTNLIMISSVITDILRFRSYGKFLPMKFNGCVYMLLLVCQISSKLYVPRHCLRGSNMSTVGFAVWKLCQTLHWTQGMKNTISVPAITGSVILLFTLTGITFSLRYRTLNIPRCYRTLDIFPRFSAVAGFAAFTTLCMFSRTFSRFHDVPSMSVLF